MSRKIDGLIDCYHERIPLTDSTTQMVTRLLQKGYSRIVVSCPILDIAQTILDTPRFMCTTYTLFNTDVWELMRFRIYYASMS